MRIAHKTVKEQMDAAERISATSRELELREQLAAEKARADALFDKVKAHRMKAEDNYWGWQGDGEDHLESLMCPVLIMPDVLSRIIARADKAETAVEEMREAIKAAISLIGNANKGAFENGNKDQSGTIDEGEVLAGRLYEDLRRMSEQSDWGTGWLSPEVREKLKKTWVSGING